MNASNIPKKLVGSEEERAVSPVIGVILMVAITVILAAVIAAFVLDIGPGDTTISAAADVSTDGDDLVVEVTSGGGDMDQLVAIDSEGDVVATTDGAATGATFDSGADDWDTGGEPVTGDVTVYGIQGELSPNDGDTVDDANANVNLGTAEDVDFSHDPA